MPHSRSKSILFVFSLFTCISTSFAQEFIHVPIGGKLLAYASNIDKIYAYGRLDDDDEQKLHQVDALTGVVELTFDLNLDIRKLAISKDGSLLYLGCHSLDSGIVVLNVPAMTIARVFSLRTIPTEGFYFISDMQVSPNDPDLLAVLGRATTHHEYNAEVRLFDHASLLPNIFEQLISIRAIQWSENKPYIFGTSNYKFLQMPYDDLGIYKPDTSYQAFRGEAALSQYDFKLYGSQGLAIEVDQDFPAQHGEIPEFGDYPLIVDETNNKILRIQPSNDSLKISAYDPDRLSSLGIKWNLPIPGPDINTITKLGPGPFFAISTAESLLEQNGFFIVRLCDVVPAAPVLDPMFNDLIILCTQPNKQVIVPPPAGYDFIIDPNGHKQDNLIITESGKYTIRVMNAQGCLSKPSTTIKTLKGTTPSTPTIEYWNGSDLVPATNLNRCVDGKTYLVINSSGTNKTQWSTGFIGDTYYTDYVGTLWANRISKEGCVSAQSNIVQINTSLNITPEPPEILSAAGFNACNNMDNIVLIAEPGYTEYHWVFGASHRDDTTITILSNGAKSYRLRAKNATGCWSDFNSVEVSFPDYGPSTPQIKQQLNQLAASLSAYAYEWFKDDLPIPNSNAQVWQILSPGAYQVRVFDGVCWSNLSFKKIIP